MEESKEEKSASDLQWSTGMADFDDIIEGLYPGDNLLIKIDKIEEYRPIVKSFLQNSVEQKRKIVYFRFSQYESLIPANISAKTINLRADEGFEPF
ncbi:MAG: hypothetical protein ACTSVL_03165, partial [Promethearchaeota archaeon]